MAGKRIPWRCRWFGHAPRWFVNNPDRPLDFTVGCPRCKDPSTFNAVATADDDPNRPGYLRVRGLSAVAAFLEGKK